MEREHQEGRKENAAMRALDPRSWTGFENFNQAQTILDHNRLLINEIKANHEARSPEGLTRNVTLIRELNNNLNKASAVWSFIDRCSHVHVNSVAGTRIDFASWNYASSY